MSAPDIYVQLEESVRRLRAGATMADLRAEALARREAGVTPIVQTHADKLAEVMSVIRDVAAQYGADKADAIAREATQRLELLGRVA